MKILGIMPEQLGATLADAAKTLLFIVLGIRIFFYLLSSLSITYYLKKKKKKGYLLSFIPIYNLYLLGTYAFNKKVGLVLMLYRITFLLLQIICDNPYSNFIRFTLYTYYIGIIICIIMLILKANKKKK